MLFYKSSHTLTILICSIAVAVVFASLSVGDSVKSYLKKKRDKAIGDVSHVLYRPGRFFTESLVDSLSKELPATKFSPGLLLSGRVSTPDSKKSINNVNVMGVHKSWKGVSSAGFNAELFSVNETFADKCGVKEGDSVILRIPRLTALPSASMMSDKNKVSQAIRFTIDRIVTSNELGDFDIFNNPITTANVFLPLPFLQEKMKNKKLINSIFVNDLNKGLDYHKLNNAIRNNWTIEDLQLKTIQLDEAKQLLQSERIFIDQNLAEALLGSIGQSKADLTYLVNSLTANNVSTPYSMVAGVDSVLAHNEIMVTEWLQEDLSLKIGDLLTLSYFAINQKDVLEERQVEFVVKKVIQDLPHAKAYMPEFPGLAKAESTRNWSSSLPIELNRVRDKDEAYWKKYRGTPKAYIDLNQAKKMWANAYGDITSLRFDGNDNKLKSTLTKLEPRFFGFTFSALEASSVGQNVDFSQLFLGFAFFLIFAALLLMGLMFSLNIDARQNEIYLLKNLGFSSSFIKKLWLSEAIVISLIGCLLAIVVVGPLFSRMVIDALMGRWSKAVVQAELVYLFETHTAYLAFVAGFVVSMLSVYFFIITRLKHNNKSKYLWTDKKPYDVCSFMLAVLLMVVVWFRPEYEVLGFYLSGFLLLLGCVMMFRNRLSHSPTFTVLSVNTLALTNVKRLKLRSMVIVTVLAATIFLVVAVGTYRVDSHKAAHESGSGTGGFEFYSESSIGIPRELVEEDLVETGLKPIFLQRKRGENASCLNLNKVTEPSLVAVDPVDFSSRNSFSFSSQLLDSDNAWDLLNEGNAQVVPGIVDANSLKWVIGKQLGDRITYKDEWGNDFAVQIVACTNNSILQGHVVVAASVFKKYYPSISGAEVILWDGVEESNKKILFEKKEDLSDYGFTLDNAADRLQAFADIENTHLSIFQSLGTLGLLLGCFALGLLIFKSVSDRRGELALLKAFGFSDRQIISYVFSEYNSLFLTAFVSGLTSALLAVWPQLTSSSIFPIKSMSLTLGILFIVIYIWMFLASKWACGRNLISALKSG